MVIINKINNKINQISFTEKQLNSYKFSDIFVFSFFLVIVPLIWVVVRALVWPQYANEMLKYANDPTYNIDKSYLNIYSISVIVFQYIFPIIAISYLFFRDREYFIKSKLWFLYFFFVLFPLIQVIFSLFNSEIAILILNSLIYPAILFFFLVKDHEYIKKVKISFIKKNIYIFILLIIFLICIFFIINFIFSIVTYQITKQNSFNQSILEKQLSSSLGKATLFFSSIIVAPIIEELTFRKFLIEIEISRFRSNTYSKIYIFLSSVIIFALMHIIQGGDIQYILMYSSLALITSATYIKTRNENICIIIHMVTNLISYIILLA